MEKNERAEQHLLMGTQVWGKIHFEAGAMDKDKKSVEERVC